MAAFLAGCLHTGRVFSWFGRQLGGTCFMGLSLRRSSEKKASGIGALAGVGSSRGDVNFHRAAVLRDSSARPLARLRALGRKCPDFGAALLITNRHATCRASAVGVPVSQIRKGERPCHGEPIQSGSGSTRSLRASSRRRDGTKAGRRKLRRGL